MMNKTYDIGFLLFADMLQMDFTGPYGVLAAAPAARIHLIGEGSARSSDGLTFAPDTGFSECPPLDVLCVPGGGGAGPLLNDGRVLSFLRAQAEHCRYMASVCTGALVLGAAGLLRGYEATTHWRSHDLLPVFGAIPVRSRVVADRNRLTSAGVSAGIDMALLLAGMLWGDEAAEYIQLGMEYAPEPPYASGTPETASPRIVADYKKRTAARQERRAAAAREAGAKIWD